MEGDAMKQKNIVKELYLACIVGDFKKQQELIAEEFRKIFKRKETGKKLGTKRIQSNEQIDKKSPTLYKTRVAKPVLKVVGTFDALAQITATVLRHVLNFHQMLLICYPHHLYELY